MTLEGKVAIITGGARGIGAGIARVFAAQGAKLALIDLDGPEAEKTAAGLGVPAIGLGADCAEEAEMERAITAVVAHFGGIDILVNNAGGGRGIGREQPRARDGGGLPMSGVMSYDQERWDEQLATNLRTTFVASKAAIPYLKARGSGAIVNIASIAGLMPSTSIVPYAAAKAGVVSLSRSLALELAPFDIRSNAICPGFLWTRAWEGMATAMKLSVPAFSDREPRDIFLDVVKRGVPLGREQTPEDIGELAAFLCSNSARNITGQVISVDGGITLK
jgi:NAD(P)-dependent dehydrogenase (short-subunit alcohol dehydrogenase family)